MNAVVSGHSGVAVLIEGDSLSSIQTWDEEVLPRRPRDLRFLFNGARDLQFLEDVDLEEVRQQLDLQSTRIDALHLALILLDSDLTHDTRMTAAEELEELLADEGIVHWVEGVLYAHPLPKSGDLAGARSACTSRTERTRAFLDRLSSLQVVIAEVHQAWESIPTQSFGNTEDRQCALSTAVKGGLFRDLVEIRAAGKPVTNFVRRSLRNPTLQEIGDTQHILTAWVRGLSSSSEEYSALGADVSYVAEAKEDDRDE